MRTPPLHPYNTAVGEVRKIIFEAAFEAAVMDCSGSDDYAPNTYLYFDEFYISPAPSKY
jgi:hypothetical protein